MKKILALTLIFSLIIEGCKKKDDDDVCPTPDRKTTTYPCGLSSPNPTYIDAKRIIKEKCATCHNNSDLGFFRQYDYLNAVCENGSFNKRTFIQKDMPPVGAPQLDSCELLILKRWYWNGHNPY